MLIYISRSAAAACLTMKTTASQSSNYMYMLYSRIRVERILASIRVYAHYVYTQHYTHGYALSSAAKRDILHRARSSSRDAASIEDASIVWYAGTHRWFLVVNSANTTVEEGARALFLDCRIYFIYYIPKSCRLFVSACRIQKESAIFKK